MVRRGPRDTLDEQSRFTSALLYRTASVVSADRIVFNTQGNDYRLVVAVDCENGIV